MGLLAVALMVLLAFSNVVCSDTNGKNSKPANEEKTNIDSAAINAVELSADSTDDFPEVIAYYFHTTYRCVSCKKIEAYSKEAIESGFDEELADGTMEFYSLNTDEDENKHFRVDYQLYTKSLIICDMKDGKLVAWKNLDKVWQLIRNKDEFMKYVQDEINAYLKES